MASTNDKQATTIPVPVPVPEILTIKFLGRCSPFSTPQFIRDVEVRVIKRHPDRIEAVLINDLPVTGSDVCGCGRHTSSKIFPAGTELRYIRMVEYQRDDAYEMLPMTRCVDCPTLGTYQTPGGGCCTTVMDPGQTHIKNKVMLRDYAIVVGG